MDYTNEEIIDSIPLAIMIAEYNGTIIGTNPALEQMLGYTQEELLGQTIETISYGEDASKDAQAFESLQNGFAPAPYVKELMTKEGYETPIEVHAGRLGDGAAVLAIKPLSEEMRLLKQLQRRNMHLLASSEVSRAATQILNPQDLIEQTVDLIREHFGFYYAAIFLIDDTGTWAILRAATSEGGKKLLEQGHKLGVGSQSMVGWVAANSAARIALDVGEEAIRFDNPMLPKTRSEMALPLRARGEVIGVLDVQSTSLNAFTEEDIQTLQIMADQVAIAIDNARLFANRA